MYVRFGEQLFRQTVGIPMGTNCALLLADLFLYSYEKSYENEFLDKLVKEGKRKLARKFNLSYRYIDDLILFRNKRFTEFISDIYPKSSPFPRLRNLLQLFLISTWLLLQMNNSITTNPSDKRDTFGFHIVNFPFLSSNIPSAPANGVYVSQFIRYACCC